MDGKAVVVPLIMDYKETCKQDRDREYDLFGSESDGVA
jgi:hypothetical protein